MNIPSDLMELNTHIKGRPGIDCCGFCSFCFYKNLQHSKLETLQFGCVNCPPHQVGCPECNRLTNYLTEDFKPLHEVLKDLESKLVYYDMWGKTKDLEIVISATADMFNYPHLVDLISIIDDSGYHVTLSYTSGKAINNRDLANELISFGVNELNFSVFSTNPDLRGRWMNDRNPAEAIGSLKIFCENIDVNASAVVIPGINDEEQIFQTASDLEEWGVKSLVLRRFANFKYQGLILNEDQPILDGVTVQTYHEFKELVERVSSEFSFQVLSFPFYSPDKDFPFAILKKENREFLKDLPLIEFEVTVITGKLAGPFLTEFFDAVDKPGKVNVVILDKEIADLITHEDLESVSLDDIKRRVLIPFGALVQDDQVRKILSKDGVKRKVVRGPKLLTHPYYENVSFNKDQLIKYEYKSFKELIDIING